MVPTGAFVQIMPLGILSFEIMYSIPGRVDGIVHARELSMLVFILIVLLVLDRKMKTRSPKLVRPIDSTFDLHISFIIQTNRNKFYDNIQLKVKTRRKQRISAKLYRKTVCISRHCATLSSKNLGHFYILDQNKNFNT